MGLKTTNYTIQNLNLTIPTAYARIINITSDMDGETSVVFEIQQERNIIGEKDALERKYLTLKLDKNEPSFSQAYIKSKEELFVGWEDDIINE